MQHSYDLNFYIQKQVTATLMVAEIWWTALSTYALPECACLSLPEWRRMWMTYYVTFLKELRTLLNIYNGTIFPLLNHAYRTPFIGQWIQSTWSVQFYRAKLERRHCDVMRLRQNVTKKFRRIGILYFLKWGHCSPIQEKISDFFSRGFWKKVLCWKIL